ncbi:MAG: DUF354 domain-containing protein [bacterium]
MKIAFYLAHPAHFHLFKNVIEKLINSKNSVIVYYNEKDVLNSLIKQSNFANICIKIKTIKNYSKYLLKIQFLQKLFGLFIKLLINRPDIIFGTSIVISLCSKLLKIDNIIVNEDDFDIINKTVTLGYPYATHILCPEVCKVLQFSDKSIKYPGYHELAYLHPENFFPNADIVKKNIKMDKPYFILRFAKLSAHHDNGISGINDEIAEKLVNKLSAHGKVYITSERELNETLEKYKISIKPIDMHHVIAFAKMYIGDSQTMAAEAGVLGVPFIRFNDFVGRINILDELENQYNLGFGIKTDRVDVLFSKVQSVLNENNLYDRWQKKRYKMLNEKIDFSKFLFWFISNYPDSVNDVKKKPDKIYQQFITNFN